MEDFNENNNYDWQTGSYDNSNNGEFYTIDNEHKPKAPAIICFVLSLLNLLCCCCWSYIPLAISIVLGIVCLVNKWRGKGFAIAGISISAFVLIITILSNVLLGELSNAMTKIVMESPKYYEEYSETGEIPEEFVEFNDEKYDWYWSITGCKDFTEFYERYMELYGQVVESQGETAITDDDFYNSDSSDNTDTTESADDESDNKSDNKTDTDDSDSEKPVEL